MQITVREATHEDTVAIAELMRVLIVYHGTIPPPTGRLMQAIEQVLQSSDAWYVVAVVASEVVGTLQINQRFSTWANAQYGFIEDFCVSEEWRSKGIGATLLAYVEQLAGRKGWVRVDVDVQRTNEAVRFYERHGFSDSGYAIYRRGAS